MARSFLTTKTRRARILWVMSGKLKDRISQFEQPNGIIGSAHKRSVEEDAKDAKPLSFKDARAAFESSNKSSAIRTKPAIAGRKPSDEATHVLPSSIKAAQKPRGTGIVPVKSPETSVIKTPTLSSTKQTLASLGSTSQGSNVSSIRPLISSNKSSPGANRPPAPPLATKPSSPAPRELVSHNPALNEPKQQTMLTSGDTAANVTSPTLVDSGVCTKPKAMRVEPSSVPSDSSSQDSSSDEADQEREIAVALKDSMPGKKTPPVPPPSRKSTNSSTTTSMSDTSSISNTPNLPPRLPSRPAAETLLNVKPQAPSLPPRQAMPDKVENPILAKQATLPPPVKKSIEARRQAQARAQANAKQSQALRKPQSTSIPAGYTSTRESTMTKSVSPDAPTPQQRQRYEALFDANSVGGSVTALFVRAIWTRSNLDQFALYRIYSLVDRGHKAELSKEEFVIGTWLIDQCLADRPIPASLGPLL